MYSGKRSFSSDGVQDAQANSHVIPQSIEKGTTHDHQEGDCRFSDCRHAACPCRMHG